VAFLGTFLAVERILPGARSGLENILVELSEFQNKQHHLVEMFRPLVPLLG
jgi:hypothetical protein